MRTKVVSSLRELTANAHPARALMWFALCLSVLAPSEAVACRYASSTTEQQVATARGIYLGTVTGQTLTGLERRLRSNPHDESIVVPEEYALRIVIRERLAGRRRTIIQVLGGLCGHGDAQLGDNVLIIQDRDGSYRF